MGIMARSTLAWLVAALSFSFSLSFPAHADEPPVRSARAPIPLDGVAAIVDDLVIFRSDVNARVRRFESKLASDPTVRRAERAKLEKALLARMIDEVLFLTDARRLRIEATDAEVNAGIESVAKGNGIDRKQLEAEVMKTGYSVPEYQEEIRKQIIEQRWLLQRTSTKLLRKRTGDGAELQAALEKEREVLLEALRSRAFIEVR
jgi:parvulin-like peptidyl-prolyl isomerase